MTSLSRTPARTFTARLAVLALGVGLAAAVQAPAHAADDPVAGAQTLTPSDTLFPNQGNCGYDASHYDVDV